MIGWLSGNGRAYHLRGEEFQSPVYRYVYEKYEGKCYECSAYEGKRIRRRWHGEWIVEDCDCNDGVVIRKRVIERQTVRHELRWYSLCGTAILRKGEGKDVKYICPACTKVKGMLDGF